MDENELEDGSTYTVLNSDEDAPIEKEDSKNVEDDPVKISKVTGTFATIENAMVEKGKIQPNDNVMFLGLICPVLSVNGDKVKIRHGNNVLELPISKVSKVLSCLTKQKVKRKWTSRYRNPLLPPHRK